MMRSLFSGVAGLKSHQTRMDVIGNNVANVNTTGFKSSRVTFQDTLSQTLTGASASNGTTGGTNPQQVGLGVSVGSIDTIMTDGSRETTGKNTDLAISGSGFFVVKNGNSNYYTRDGAFSFDDSGNYVLPGSGYKVQGWLADSSGNINATSATSDIVIPANTSMAAKATTEATFSKNLSADTSKTTISTMTVTLANGKSLIVPATNTTEYALKDGISGTITNVSAKLSDGSVVAAGSTATGVGFTNGTAVSGTTVSSMQVTLADGTVVSAATGSALSAQLDAKTSGSTISALTVTLDAGTLATPSTTTAYKIGQTLKGTVDATDNTKVNLSDGSTITGLTGLTSGDSYTATVNSLAATMSGTGTTVTKVGSGSFQIGKVLGSTVSSIDNVALSGNATLSTAGSGKFTVGSALSGKISSLTVTTASGDYQIPTSNASDTFKTGTTIEADLGGTAGTGLSIAGISMTLANGSTSSAIAKTSYGNGGSLYAPVSTVVTVYDSLGTAHSVPVVLTKTARNTWNASLVPNQSDGTTTKIDGATVTGTLGNITFDDSTGTFSTGTGYSLSLTNYTNGATSSDVTLDFSGLTQYAGESTATTGYNGYAAGSLNSVAFDSSGIATGSFSNGQTRSLAQVAMATFNNPAGLDKSGGSLYSASNDSGTVQIATVSGSGSKVTPSALEMSNVDLASEFSSMIVTQRGYQSNSKIITVSDEMLETLIGMKR